MRVFAALAATTAVLAALTAPAHAQPAKAPSDTITLPVQDALAQLPIRAENRAGYTRAKFKHWIDADKDGCNTRAEVLKAEAVIPPQQAANCALSGGEWYSAYDDRYFDDARKLDVDHLVPLAEAWDSGASAWTAKEREAYANDLTDPRALIAVSAASNRSKADKDPAQWLPPYTPDRCEYVTDWVAIKTRYSLGIDPVEREALTNELDRCPDRPITVTLVR